MNKQEELCYATRSTITLELPLAKNTRILHPDRVIIKIGNATRDLGALCYGLRSTKHRAAGQPLEVVQSSFLKSRPRQIRQVIKILSSLITESGLRLPSVQVIAYRFNTFLDWADLNGHYDCLAGGDATRQAYQGWIVHIHERYLMQEFGEGQYYQLRKYVGDLLEPLTGLDGLDNGMRRIRSANPNSGTEPLAQHDFAQGLALGQALFDGLCDLVLGNRDFPYKLVLPASLSWAENYLWLFPTTRWYLLPHLRGVEREKYTNAHWAYDYANGCLISNPDDIAQHYTAPTPSKRRKTALNHIAQAQAQIDAANADMRHRMRIKLGMFAHDAFLFLFISNTTANAAVVREIETEGEIDAATSNQHFRSIKFRAKAKSISPTVPTTFMPTLRRFMEVRRYLLAGKTFPFLFFSLGRENAEPPKQFSLYALDSFGRNFLRKLDPRLPRMESRKLRASGSDWYQRNHDVSITAKVIQSSEQTTRKRYDAGSATNHKEEISLFLNSVSKAAKRQRVVARAAEGDSPLLEEGGRCDRFGHPEALANHVPVEPNCKSSQGCLFCMHRVLVACEEDARKVASAAFVMEQVVFGPKHEEALRPLIKKCDQDMEKIASFGNCREMVERVRKEVFENGNLTPFFADKFQLFLELGVIA